MSNDLKANPMTNLNIFIRRTQTDIEVNTHTLTNKAYQLCLERGLSNLLNNGILPETNRDEALTIARANLERLQSLY